MRLKPSYYQSTLIGAIKHAWNFGKSATSSTLWKPEYGTLQDQHAKDLDGKDFDFSSTKGKVVLIVNVACDCGYTKSSYTAMSELYSKYADQGFEIIAFPSNQFGAQESRPEDEIKDFVKTKYNVKFPLLAKGDVNGDNTHPLYQWLKKSLPGDITWNFAAKFIINQAGVPVERLEKENWTIIENKIKGYLKDAQDLKAANAADGNATADASTSAPTSAPTPDDDQKPN